MTSLGLCVQKKLKLLLCTQCGTALYLDNVHSHISYDKDYHYYTSRHTKKEVEEIIKSVLTTSPIPLFTDPPPPPDSYPPVSPITEGLALFLNGYQCTLCHFATPSENTAAKHVCKTGEKKRNQASPGFCLQSIITGRTNLVSYYPTYFPTPAATSTSRIPADEEVAKVHSRFCSIMYGTTDNPLGVAAHIKNVIYQSIGWESLIENERGSLRKWIELDETRDVTTTSAKLTLFGPILFNTYTEVGVYASGESRKLVMSESSSQDP